MDDLRKTIFERLYPDLEEIDAADGTHDDTVSRFACMSKEQVRYLTDIKRFCVYEEKDDTWRIDDDAAAMHTIIRVWAKAAKLYFENKHNFTVAEQFEGYLNNRRKREALLKDLQSEAVIRCASSDLGDKLMSDGGGQIDAVPVSGQALYEEDIPPLEWIVPDYMPAEGVSIISGPPKSYKSFLAMQICLAVATGGTFFGKRCEQRICLYADLEGGKRREKDRLQKMGATWDDLKNIRLIPGGYIGVIGDGLEEWIAKQKKDLPALRLLVIDIFQLVRAPLNRYSGNAYSVDTKEIKALDAIARKLNIAILLVHHNKKGKEADVFDNMSGSTGMSGAVTCAWQIGKERYSDNATISIMGNDLEGQQLVAYFDKEHFKWVCRGNEETVRQSQIDEAYYQDPQIAAVKRILEAAADSTWSGTYKDFCRVAGDLGYNFDVSAAAGREFKKKVYEDYKTHLENDGYSREVRHLNKGWTYTFTKGQPKKAEQISLPLE